VQDGRRDLEEQYFSPFAAASFIVVVVFRGIRTEWSPHCLKLLCFVSRELLRSPVVEDASESRSYKGQMMLHFIPRTRVEILFMSLSSPSESFLVTKAQMQNKIELHFLSLLLSCSFLLGFCACSFIFYLLMHVDVKKSSLWRTNLLRVRIRGESLQRNEASKWVFFPDGWNPWHWGSLTLCWSLTPSCLSSTTGSEIEASLNIGFISIKLLPSQKQSLCLNEDIYDWSSWMVTRLTSSFNYCLFLHCFSRIAMETWNGDFLKLFAHVLAD